MGMGSDGNGGTGDCPANPNYFHTGSVPPNPGFASFTGSRCGNGGNYMTVRMDVPDPYNGYTAQEQGEHYHNVIMNTAGGSTAHNNVQPSLIVQYIIKI
jgi:microcystin-dependent protein